MFASDYSMMQKYLFRIYSILHVKPCDVTSSADGCCTKRSKRYVAFKQENTFCRELRRTTRHTKRSKVKGRDFERQSLRDFISSFIGRALRVREKNKKSI